MPRPGSLTCCVRSELAQALGALLGRGAAVQPHIGDTGAHQHRLQEGQARCTHLCHSSCSPHVGEREEQCMQQQAPEVWAVHRAQHAWHSTAQHSTAHSAARTSSRSSMVVNWENTTLLIGRPLPGLATAAEGLAAGGPAAVASPPASSPPPPRPHAASRRSMRAAILEDPPAAACWGERQHVCDSTPGQRCGIPVAGAANAVRAAGAWVLPTVAACRALTAAAPAAPRCEPAPPSCVGSSSSGISTSLSAEMGPLHPCTQRD